MQEKSSHYSNKGGHWRRSQFNKSLTKTIRLGIQPCKSDISFCMRRFAKRVPDDGKR